MRAPKSRPSAQPAQVRVRSEVPPEQLGESEDVATQMMAKSPPKPSPNNRLSAEELFGDDEALGDAEPAPTGAPQEAAAVLRAKVAPLWRRLVAWGVDGTILTACVWAYLTLAARVTGIHDELPGLGGLDGLIARAHRYHALLGPALAVALLLGAAYAALFALVWNGCTPGRKVAGLRLVDHRGLPLPAPRAVVRGLFSSVSFGLFLLGYWIAVVDSRGQTLHDKLSQSFVVRPL